MVLFLWVGWNAVWDLWCEPNIWTLIHWKKWSRTASEWTLEQIITGVNRISKSLQVYYPCIISGSQNSASTFFVENSIVHLGLFPLWTWIEAAEKWNQFASGVHQGIELLGVNMTLDAHTAWLENNGVSQARVFFSIEMFMPEGRTRHLLWSVWSKVNKIENCVCVKQVSIVTSYSEVLKKKKT